MFSDAHAPYIAVPGLLSTCAPAGGTHRTINNNSSSACLKQIYNIRCMCISLHAGFDEPQHICIYQNVYRHYAATSQVESTRPSLSLIRSTFCTESDMNWVTFTLGSTNRRTYLYVYIYIYTPRDNIITTTVHQHNTARRNARRD